MSTLYKYSEFTDSEQTEKNFYFFIIRYMRGSDTDEEALIEY